jgi:(p)ppGpp synthase/HD superfamily hydrolase
MIKEIIVRAYNYSKEKHDGQKRKFTKIDYFTHPKAVARIIEDLTKKDYLVAVALLHDVIEDTDAEYHDIVRLFGQRIACLVMELTETEEKRKGLKKVDYLIREMKNMSEEALTVKLADRFHNVRFLEIDITDVEHYGFMQYYAKQTKQILNSLKYSELTYVQQILYDGIINVIKYIEVKHWRKE